MKKSFGQLKIAIVHEWFVNHAGSEKVVEELLNIFPQAQLFALVDFLPENKRQYLGGRKVSTSFIQRLPFSKNHFRKYFPLFPLAVEGHDLREYDLIISSSHMVSKGLLCRQDQLHISYVHSPCRFAWDLYHQYLQEAGLQRGFQGLMAQYFLHRLRSWDIISLNRVHHFVANSYYIGKRIFHVYRRSSDVIYPPVDTLRFRCQPEKKEYYFAAGRPVPYKKLDIILRAFAAMPDKQLVLCLAGNEQIAVPPAANIQIRRNVPDGEFTELMAASKALLFAAEEDFGITMAEALACGTPVIAFRRGGASEIIAEGCSGILFNEQTVSCVKEAVEEFELNGVKWDAMQISRSAERFSGERFRQDMLNLVQEKWDQF